VREQTRGKIDLSEKIVKTGPAKNATSTACERGNGIEFFLENTQATR